ncbi:CPBP family intramembrane glutamic endopeptidase [Nocardioides sp. SYSU DS0663]|uniref:CPBP family intramembrane glutamic endopeptidase n=1 Tax=Nocardioides sp. SYSU DS0663 TaxID=3416445 RepID=UPI003F4C2554
MPVTGEQRRALAFGTAVHLARFGVILLALALADLLGIAGWYAGLFANALCVVFAAALVTYFGLWRRIGLTTVWRGRTAALLLLVPLAEALWWLLPAGLAEEPPGFGLWALTLLLVGVNEELVSRGVVLERMRRSFRPGAAVVTTAALFGLQHLSAFATTSRGASDILLNVLASGCYGFALAAFQLRFSWLAPLVLVHALADFTAILSADGPGDLAAAGISVVFVGYGVLVLRGAGSVGDPGRGPVGRP